MTDPLVVPSGSTVYLAAPRPPVVVSPAPAPTGVLVVPVQGPPGPPGVGVGSLAYVAVTARALSGHRVVTMTPDGLDYASSDEIEHATAPLWLTTSAWADGVPATVTTRGVIEEGSWAWSPGPLFLGLNGVLSPTIPGGAVFARIVAGVVDSTTIDYQPQPAILIGA